VGEIKEVLTMKRLFFWILASLLVLASPAWAACPLFPADNVWNTPIDQLPLDPRSSAYIDSIGANAGLHPDFGSGTWDGGPIGIPYNIVSGAQPKVSVVFDYADESDSGPYPIPLNPALEHGGDHHLLILDEESCVLYETWDTRQTVSGAWEAGSGAIFDLRSNALRLAGWTSADAAGLPILPGLARCEDIATGIIRHALRFTAERTQRKFVWPARHYASSITNPDTPPMGQRFRLKASFDLSGYSPQTRIILQALKTYGMFLADNGGDWFISGAPGACWDDERWVDELRTVKGSDFEAVDQSGLMVNPDSAQVRSEMPDLTTLTIQVLGDGKGRVTSDPAGIDCGATCAASFAPDTPVQLTAITAAGSVFTGWGGACQGTATTTNLVLDADRVCSATFAATASDQADLTVNLAQRPRIAHRGRLLSYQVTVINEGSATASSLELRVNLPNSFAFLDASTGCIYANGTVTCSQNALTPDAVQTFKIRVRSLRQGRFDITARATSATADPNPDNNEVTFTTRVVRTRASL